ncbi:response regulator [Desulfococcaceae bacterium HSG7]|nr:response regulator [Desulfococcaceae bacterium HSG7]
MRNATRQLNFMNQGFFCSFGAVIISLDIFTLYIDKEKIAFNQFVFYQNLALQFHAIRDSSRSGYAIANPTYCLLKESAIENCKLLVIEDNKSLAKQIKWGLGGSYDIMLAGNAEKAINLLSTGAFPVATLDLGLPPAPDTPENGLRLLEDLERLNLHTKIIVISGCDQPEIAVKAISLGPWISAPNPLNWDS